MNKVLITGAGGFVGSRIAHHMRDRWEIADFPRGLLATAAMQDIETAILRAEPALIVHTAAIADMGECDKDPEGSYRANVLLTETVCRAARKLGVKALCFSTDQVYNGCDPADGPYHEDIPLAPVNVYGRHKLEAENRGLDICPDAVMLRATWMYDLPGDGLPIRGNMLMNLLAQAKENRTERYSVNDLRGITYVRQVAQLTEEALNLPGGAYNFGSPNNADMYQTALAALRALDLPETLAAANAQGRARCLAMKPDKLRSFGLVFDDTLDGFKRCVQAAESYCKAVESGI